MTTHEEITVDNKFRNCFNEKRIKAVKKTRKKNRGNRY